MDDEKEPIAFSDEELYKALDKHVKSTKKPVIVLDENPDPGTITRPELEKRYGFGRSAARRHIEQLLEDGIIRRDWVWRYSEWPPHDKGRRQGYRYVDPGKEDEPVQSST